MPVSVNDGLVIGLSGTRACHVEDPGDVEDAVTVPAVPVGACAALPVPHPAASRASAGRTSAGRTSASGANRRTVMRLVCLAPGRAGAASGDHAGLSGGLERADRVEQRFDPIALVERQGRSDEPPVAGDGEQQRVRPAAVGLRQDPPAVFEGGDHAPLAGGPGQGFRGTMMAQAG